MREHIETLGDALPKEIARAQEILAEYIAIGPSGAFGAAMIRANIATATKAMAEDDFVGMIQAYNALKEIKS